MKIAPALTAGPRGWLHRVSRAMAAILPKRLYARALLIVIAPVVLLQSILLYAFLERHWELVTRRLSSAVTADIAALIQVWESYPQDAQGDRLSAIGDLMALDVDILEDSELPPPGPKPFFSILDRVLSDEIRRRVRRPYWLDTLGRSNLIEIRVQLDDRKVMRVLARRSLAYASNSHIFIMWMVGSSLVLIGVAVVILRNQIRPIVRLSEAAEAFGKGREIEFRPRGASEVRQAGRAFIEMKRRIERAIDQRTTMLNGVSHDLRTILTRFRLSLALQEEGPEIDALRKDVDEMTAMLEGYLAFARGDTGEASQAVDIAGLLEDVRTDTARHGHTIEIKAEGDMAVTVRPAAMRRLVTNLVTNAVRHAPNVEITARRDGRWLSVIVDDDGPGIPPDQREEVFKPFVRLDEARNIDEGGSGLGLAIARDIARSHGGDVTLTDSPLGGLRAVLRVPV